MTQGKEKHSNMVTGIAMRFGTIAATLAVEAAFLFGGAGRLDWLWAWAYLGISLATVLSIGSVMLCTHPETISERGRPKEMRGWDKVVSGVGGLALYLALPLVAGLDARFGWSPALNLLWHLAGAAGLVAGFGLPGWAMIANAYFSTVVRIQSERGHTVCRGGPYRVVRHPGYVGFMLQALGMPLLLGSLWALMPGITGLVFLVIRTALEDRMLHAELPGYRDYAQEVRYRLIPGIW